MRWQDVVARKLKNMGLISSPSQAAQFLKEAAAAHAAALAGQPAPPTGGPAFSFDALGDLEEEDDEGETPPLLPSPAPAPAPAVEPAPAQLSLTPVPAPPPQPESPSPVLALPISSETPPLPNVTSGSPRGADISRHSLKSPSTAHTSVTESRSNITLELAAERLAEAQAAFTARTESVQSMTTESEMDPQLAAARARILAAQSGTRVAEFAAAEKLIEDALRVRQQIKALKRKTTKRNLRVDTDGANEAARTGKRPLSSQGSTRSLLGADDPMAPIRLKEMQAQIDELERKFAQLKEDARTALERAERAHGDAAAPAATVLPTSVSPDLTSTPLMHDGGYVLGSDKMRHKAAPAAVAANVSGQRKSIPLPAVAVKEEDDESVRSAGDFDNLTVSDLDFGSASQTGAPIQSPAHIARKRSARAMAAEHAATLGPADELMRAACVKLDALNAAFAGVPAATDSSRDEAETSLDKALASVLHVRQLRRGMAAAPEMVYASAAASRADGHQWWADKDAGRYAHLPFAEQKTQSTAPARGDVALMISQFVQRQVEASAAVAHAEAILNSVASSMLADATSRLSVARSKLPSLETAVAEAEQSSQLTDEEGLMDMARRIGAVKLSCAKTQGAIEALFGTQGAPNAPIPDFAATAGLIKDAEEARAAIDAAHKALRGYIAAAEAARLAAAAAAKSKPPRVSVSTAADDDSDLSSEDEDAASGDDQRSGAPRRRRINFLRRRAEAAFRRLAAAKGELTAMEQLYTSLQSPDASVEGASLDVASVHESFQRLLASIGSAELSASHTRAMDGLHKAALAMVEAKTIENVVVGAIEAARAAAAAADAAAGGATAVLSSARSMGSGGATALSSPNGKALTLGGATASFSPNDTEESSKRTRLTGEMVKMLETSVYGAVGSVTSSRDAVHSFVRMYGQVLAAREKAPPPPSGPTPEMLSRIAGENALQVQDARLASTKKRFNDMDLRALPPSATSTYPQAPRPNPETDESQPPTPLDLAMPQTQRAIAAVQDSGLKLAHADTVRPMVDVSSGGPDSASLKHYTLMVDAAEAAVHHTELVVAAALQAQIDAIANRDRASKEQRWNEAVGHLMAVVASIDALSARNRADESPADAGTTALREAVAAATEADSIVLRVPKNEEGTVYIDSVTPADFTALAAATQHARSAAAAASTGMDRRPEFSAVRQKLRDALALHREATDRLKAAKAALEANGSTSPSLPMTSKATIAAAEAIDAAAKSGAEASNVALSCKSAWQRDAVSGGFENRALVPLVAESHEHFTAKTAEATACVAALLAAKGAEHKRSGADAFEAQNERLELIKQRYDGLDLRVLPAAVTAAYAQRRSHEWDGPVPAQLDQLLPGTQKTIAAVQDAGMKLVHADAVRVSIGPSRGACYGPQPLLFIVSRLFCLAAHG